MRTKALVITALLSAAGMVAANAQVYSVNVVGYVTVTKSGNGYHILSVPLISTNTTLQQLCPNPPDDAKAWGFQGSWKYAEALGGWLDDFTLAPGEGFFFKMNLPSDTYTVTFVGEVAEKTASNKNLPVGLTLQGSLVPQAGNIDDPNTLNLPGADDGKLWGRSADGMSWKYTEYLGGWLDSVNIGVGEGFWYLNPTASPIPWNRNFTVPQ